MFRGAGFPSSRVPGSKVLQDAKRPCLVSQKTSEIDVKNRPCLSNEVASLDDLVNRAQVF